MDYNQMEQNQVPTYAADPGQSAPRKFSGPGIASFIVSLLTIIGYITSIVMITSSIIDLVDQPTTIIAEDIMQRSGAIGGVVLFMGSGLLNLIALILGIIGMALKNRKKVFAILGTIFSVLPILVLIVLFAIGSSIN